MSTSRFRQSLRSLMLIAALFFAQYAFCWGVVGHRVVAEVAQQHLSKKAKRELKKIIGRESLAWSANWPDFIKSDTSWRHASSWHYVNVAGHLSKDAFIAALKALPGKNLYSQILEMKAQLKNQSLPVEQRRQALAFLIHFIGDLHQPLHVGRAEDQGGNNIVVYWFDKKTNLHSVWDNAIVEFQQYSYTEYSRELDIASEAQVKAWQSSPLEDWFYESNQLADSIYASAPNESKLGYKYNYDFKNVLDQQLLKGGLRLAAVLNEVFE